MSRAPGFTVVELLIGTSLTLAITASALALVRPVQSTFRTQLDTVDVSQRLRAAMDAIARDLMLAGSGLPSGVAALAPFRSGAGESGLTLRYLSVGGAETTHSYYVRVDPETSVSELRRSDGATDVPVVDHVVASRFTCFDDVSTVVAACAESSRIRRVQVELIVEPVSRPPPRSGRMLREAEVVMAVAPRALQRSE